MRLRRTHPTAAHKCSSLEHLPEQQQDPAARGFQQPCHAALWSTFIVALDAIRPGLLEATFHSALHHDYG